MLADAFEALRESWVVVPPVPGAVQGMAKIQASSVTITVPDGSSSEITVNANIRAAYYPDSGTTDLPAPIHGDVQAAFEVEVRTILISLGTQLFSLVTRLFITPSSEDAKIQFHAAPGSGLSAADESTLAVQVRDFLRQSLTLLPIDLPTDFPFSAFKGLGSGSSGVIALPFQLSKGASAPASGVQPLTQSFIGSSGFAVAVSKEYVIGLIDIEAIRAAINSYPPFQILGVTVHLSVTSAPPPTFQSGGIEISGEVAALAGQLRLGSISFKQLITLFFTSPQTVSLVRRGDPDVNQPFFMSHDYAVSIVRTQIDNALIAITPSVRQVFTDARNKLLQGLNTFDRFASVSFTDIEITPDGVIVRGDIGTAARGPPVVDIAETNQSTAFTAFESWIPAGRIDRFIWSWVEHRRDTVLEGVEKSFTDEHRFIFPKPAGAPQLGQICLRIEGIQTLPGGQEVNVAGGTTCHLPEPVIAMDFPSWFGPVTLPIWQPGLADSTVLKNAIAAHVSVQANVPGKEPLSRNVLLYFPDWRSERPLDTLNAALAKVKDTSALMVIVVLPAGTFDRSRREIESKLPRSGERRVLVQFTEDDEGGWTHTFAVTKRPSVYLINAKREFVWKQEGDPDPAELAAAIDQHLVPTSEPRFRPLRLTVSHGDPAPDIQFETDAGDQFALHRFRGREVLMNFWQSWSAPCLTELGRLQRLHAAGGKAPFIVAFHGGNNRDALEEIRRRLGLSFALVQDSQQRVAQQYGVRCWPTTITVDADGRAEHIQFGIGHEQLRTPEQSEPAVRPT
jgi:peroxiredoxin